MNIHLISPLANCVSFVDYEPSELPSYKNRLHEDLKQPGKKINCYSQKFNYGDTIALQFNSDRSAPPILRVLKNGVQVNQYQPSSTIVRTGTEGTRYYFNYSIQMISLFYDQEIYFKVTQELEALMSEPILCYNMNEDLYDYQVMKRVDYSNFDKFDTDLRDFLIDWESLDTTNHLMFFYIGCENNEPNDSDESENLDGALNKTKISSTNYIGNILKTEPVPQYMFRRLELVSSLDFFAVNNVEYLKEGNVESEIFGTTTSVQCTMKLTDKLAAGINVDNFNFETMSEIIQVNGRTYEGVSADFDVVIPDGYMYHLAIVKHSPDSSGNEAVITIGSTLGGSDLCDEFAGVIDEATKTFTFDTPDLVSRVYFGVSGIGIKLDVYVQWLIKQQ